MCFIPYQGLFMCLSFSILLLMVSFWWSCRYGGCEGKLASHILLSQRLDPKEKQVINLDQDVQVCGYFWWMVEELLLYNFLSPLYIFGMGYIFFFSLFFDTPCGHVAYFLWVCIFFTRLVGMWHTFFEYASFISFCIAHTF